MVNRLKLMYCNIYLGNLINFNDYNVTNTINKITKTT